MNDGSQASVRVLTATDRAKAEMGVEPVVSVVEIASEGRVFGPRFGSLVHAVLATVALDSTFEQVQASVKLHGRILGVGKEEIEAAAPTIFATLQHPLMARARVAAPAGACRREVPVTLREQDGTIIEGAADLAFREAGSWIVVDFKTDQELASRLQHYKRQLSIYASAVCNAAGHPAEAFLFRV